MCDELCNKVPSSEGDVYRRQCVKQSSGDLKGNDCYNRCNLVNVAERCRGRLLKYSL